MATQILHVLVDRDGDRVRVACAGEIDGLSMTRLETALEDVYAEPAAAIELDLEAVTFIDSRGVGALLAASRRAEAVGASFEVVPSHIVRRVLEACGLTELLGVRS